MARRMRIARRMRWWLAPIVLAFGCAPTMPPPPAAPELAPGQQPGELMDTSVFGAKVAGLRATLARHGVQIDTSPAVIDTCTVDRSGGGEAGCVRCEVATRFQTVVAFAATTGSACAISHSTAG